MSDEYDRDPAAAALRASLARHADEAPPGGMLAERIIHAAPTAAPGRGRRLWGWRTWALPLVAAGAVGAVVAAVSAIENYHPSAHATPAAPHTPTPSLTTSAPPPVSPARTGHAVAPAGQKGLRAVHVLDLTFAGVDEGWALASADCVSGPGRCTALLRTTDGRTWRDVRGGGFNVPGVRNCADPCVRHLRFANPQVGYAYGQDAFFMTTNGGLSWSRAKGGAILLESLDNNVVRVTSSGTGCPGPCDIRVETAALGAANWTAAELGPLSGSDVALSRGGSAAYLLLRRNPAGGAQDATSTLYSSTDDGRHWSAAGEPCPQGSHEVDSVAVTAAPDGRVSVLCTERSAQHGSFVANSTDAGRHFARQAGTVPAATAGLLTGDAATVLVTGGTGLARSTDAGATWRTMPDVTGSVTFIGFESRQVGRAVTDGGRSIWTTRDGGATWSAVRFS
jgi:photosystem II stability/assembly factor-like uncharacterized protein